MLTIPLNRCILDMLKCDPRSRNFRKNLRVVGHPQAITVDGISDRTIEDITMAGTIETGLAVTVAVVAVAASGAEGVATGGAGVVVVVVTDGVVVMPAVVEEGEVALTAVIKDGEIPGLCCNLVSALFRM